MDNIPRAVPIDISNTDKGECVRMQDVSCWQLGREYAVCRVPVLFVVCIGSLPSMMIAQLTVVLGGLAGFGNKANQV